LKNDIFLEIVVSVDIFFFQFFTGSYDSVSEVSELLSTPQIPRYVRLKPMSWQKHIALKWDLVGCPLYGQKMFVGEILITRFTLYRY
jgi:hypothetical protein